MKKKLNIKIKLFLILFHFGVAFTACQSPSDDMKTEEIDWVDNELWYKYSNGMEFHVKFEKEGLSYQALSRSTPDVWWGPFPYQSTITDKKEHLIAWYEEGYGDHVTILVDTEKKTLYGSALIIKKGKPNTHLLKGTIYKSIIK